MHFFRFVLWLSTLCCINHAFRARSAEIKNERTKKVPFCCAHSLYAYPLSERQIKKGLSNEEMRSRIATSIRSFISAWRVGELLIEPEEELVDKSFLAHSFKSDLWAQQLRIWNRILNARRTYILNMEQAELMRPRAHWLMNLSVEVGHAVHQMMNWQEPSVFEDFYAKALLDRVALVEHSLWRAAPKKKRKVDYDTLIELLVTETNAERVVTRQRREFCNYESVNVPQMSAILAKLCEDKRDESFHKSEENGAENAFLHELHKFMTNANGMTQEELEELANTLIHGNYQLLRKLFAKLVKFVTSKNAPKIIKPKTSLADPSKKLDIKVLKAIIEDVRIGRPYFFARRLKIQTDLLEEKLNGKYNEQIVHDAFRHISRIILTRASIDLADINDEFKSMNSDVGLENVFDRLLQRLDQEKANEMSMRFALRSYTEILHWAHAFDRKRLEMLSTSKN